MKPVAGLRQLLSQVIDYAGLFPPAKLPLDDALHHYARYRREGEAWMLGRFIIPASRLEELKKHAPLFGEGTPFTFAALASGGASAAALLEGLQEDLQAIAAFEKQHSSRVVVDVLEMQWPTIPAAETATLLESVAACIEQHKGPLTLMPFFEVGLTGDWRDSVTAFIIEMKHFREDRAFNVRRRCKPPGLKLRCGGLNAAQFPSPEQIAFVLHSCLAHRVPLKATAGLHHPLRHYCEDLRTKMHGFLNVFGAGVLGEVHGLDEARLQTIIEDEEAAHFVCDKHGFAWKDLHATVQEIAFARHEAIVSFGSCSFDEPRDDLRTLGWLLDPETVLSQEIGGEA